jgi:hypothetical protein
LADSDGRTRAKIAERFGVLHFGRQLGSLFEQGAGVLDERHVR